MDSLDLFHRITSPLGTLQWVRRDTLTPNDYNPNLVLRDVLDLLKQSIITNGWTLPIVVRPDFTIIDGYHRWLVSGEDPIFSALGGQVPVVVVAHKDSSHDIYGTVTHNRARGVHLLAPMRAIIQRLFDAGKTVDEITKELGMRPEEVFRLAGLSREEFLKMMAKTPEYSKARSILRADMV